MFHVKHGRSLPFLTFHKFESCLKGCSPTNLSNTALTSLYLHYTELLRWNPKLSLIGPGTIEDVLKRHYSESLAALPMFLPADRTMVDIGSGAGFPGLVLAAALPRLHATLIEPRHKKWVFLRSSLRRCKLPCECLNDKVGSNLPEGFPGQVDVVTCRAVAVTPRILEAIFFTSPHIRLLLWHGKSNVTLPSGFAVVRELKIKGSKHRKILEIRKSSPA